MTSPAYHYDLDSQRGVLALHGELGDPASTELRGTIMRATGELTSDLAIDLADVTFLPSPAIGVLASTKAGARRHGATITFVAPPGSVAAKMLTICALDYVDTLA